MCFCMPRWAWHRVMMLPRYCGGLDDARLDVGFDDALDMARIGHVAGVVDRHHFPAAW